MKETLKPDDPQTYDAFVDYAARHIHSGLLENGGKGLRSAIYGVLIYHATWIERARNTKGAKI